MAKSLRTGNYTSFINRLRQARIESGLKQTEVEEKLKKPQSFISKAERGERRLDVTELSDIAKIYGKRLDYFVK